MPAPYTVMGILDVTPESPEALAGPFDVDAAIRRGIALADAGAGIAAVLSGPGRVPGGMPAPDLRRPAARTGESAPSGTRGRGSAGPRPKLA